MTSRRSVMIVSERLDPERRARMANGIEPRTEGLLLEREHGVELHDWSRLGSGRVRSPGLAMRHVGAVLAGANRYDAILSDGEHVGIPLALAKRALRIRAGHLVIGHHLTVGKKAPFFRLLRAHTGMSAVLLHSRRQQELAEHRLGIDAARLKLVPYAVDQRFWTAGTRSEEPLIVSAGREHRDYTTLAAALSDLPVCVMVAAGSLHSPTANWSAPTDWPFNFLRLQATRVELRKLYARSLMVVVPLLESDFQAGVTTILEAMSMAKPVIASATSGLADVIVDGETGILVPPGDVGRLRAAASELLGDRHLRRRLGENARTAVESGFSVDAYARRLAAELEATARER